MNSNKNIIFAGPMFDINENLSENKKLIKNFKLKKKLDASLMICDLQKVKKIGFFDEDYFLYWEDKDLMERVNNSDYTMIQVENSFVSHDGGKSTIDNSKVKFIRRINFKYGELLFDSKYKKIRIIKIIRQILQNLFFIPLNLIIFNKTKLIENISQILGILKFIKYIFLKKNSKNN